jgi:FeS assembly SUF system protein
MRWPMRWIMQRASLLEDRMMSVSENQEKPDVREGIVHTTLAPEEVARLSDDIIAALKTVYDPEIPADIFELGLIYKIDIEDDRMVKIMMTLTAPGCPVAGEMPGWVENAVGAIEGVSGVQVEMTFDPPWTPDRMSEEAQVAVGWY